MYIIDKLPDGTTIKKIKEKCYKVTNRNLNIEIYAENSLDNIEARFLSRIRQLARSKKRQKTEVLKGSFQFCERCGARDNLSIDHIVPKKFFKLFEFGQEANFKGNMTILCKKCNSLKGDNIDCDDPITKQIIIDFLKSKKIL
jgi:hypothetical protein